VVGGSRLYVGLENDDRPPAAGAARGRAPTSVALFDQGLFQVLQAAVAKLVTARLVVVNAVRLSFEGDARMKPRS